MTKTVPNWIADAVAVDMAFGRVAHDASVYLVKSWRATKTRVMVVLEGYSTNEVAFRLEDLKEVGRPSYSCLQLLPPDSPEVAEAARNWTVRQALTSVRRAAHSWNVDSDADPDVISGAIDDLMKVCSAAIIKIAEVSE